MIRDRLFAPDGEGNSGGGDPPPEKKPEFVSAADFSTTTGALNSKFRKLETSLADIGTRALTKEALFESLTEAGVFKKEGDKYVPTFTAGAPAKPPKDENVPDPRFLALERQIGDLTKQAKAKDDELKAEREKTATTLRKNAVIAALTAAGAHKPERDYVHLLSADIQTDASGAFFVPGKDKYENEIQVPLSEVATKYLTENPELKVASGRPGSGTPASGGNGGAPVNGAGVKVIPHSQYTDMGWYAKNREKFQSGEYVMGPAPRDLMGAAPGRMAG